MAQMTHVFKLSRNNPRSQPNKAYREVLKLLNLHFSILEFGEELITLSYDLFHYNNKNM